MGQGFTKGKFDCCLRFAVNLRDANLVTFFQPVSGETKNPSYIFLQIKLQIKYFVIGLSGRFEPFNRIARTDF